MKLFGVYKGKLYIFVSTSTAQGFSTYREYTLASSYVSDGTFAFSLNNMNIDVNIQMSENHYQNLSNEWRGLQSILIIPDGNIIPQARFLSVSKGEVKPTINRYSQGYLQTSRSQWYGETSQIVNAFTAILKFYDPEVIDTSFLEKIRYISDLHEYFKLYTIDVEKFLDDLGKVAAHQMTPAEAEANWGCIEIDRPVVVNQLTVKDLRPFNLAEVVYWDSLEKDTSQNDKMEVTEATPAVKEAKSEPTLKLVANI